MSHGGHPRDWPTLACPSCGNGSLLCYGAVACQIIDCPGPAVRVYGNATDMITVPVQLKDDPEKGMCFCHKSGCDWIGTIKEAKALTGLYTESEADDGFG